MIGIPIFSISLNGVDPEGTLFRCNSKLKLWLCKKSCHTPFFWKGYEGDPLSPPEGEAAQGEHPLDPFSPVFKENFSSTSRGPSHFFMNASARAEATIAAA